MARLAIIPARGGSKRIPGKNIRKFLGKPIISYSIEAALKSGLFQEVMVSTDSEEIAKVALEYGAKVPFFRRAENADDLATTVDVLNEVLGNYADNGREFDQSCCIYPTAPFVTPELLSEAKQLLEQEKRHCVFPVIPFSYPVQRALVFDHAGRIKMNSPEFLNFRSQDLSPFYHDAGQFYFFDTPTFIKIGKLWTDNTGAIIIDELRAQDIDTETDWRLAELKFEMIYREKYHHFKGRGK